MFAIPGSIHSPLSRGCHRLIREGAKLVETAEDVIEELRGRLGWPTPAPSPRGRRRQDGNAAASRAGGAPSPAQQTVPGLDDEAGGVDRVDPRAPLPAHVDGGAVEAEDGFAHGAVEVAGHLRRVVGRDADPLQQGRLVLRAGADHGVDQRLPLPRGLPGAGRFVPAEALVEVAHVGGPAPHVGRPVGQHPKRQDRSPVVRHEVDLVEGPQLLSQPVGVAVHGGLELLRERAPEPRQLQEHHVIARQGTHEGLPHARRLGHPVDEDGDHGRTLGSGRCR